MIIHKSNNGCSPTMIQHTTHHLSQEQVAFLNRGPTYVLPGQLHRWSTLSSNDLLLKQMAPLQRQLTRIFGKYPVDLSRRMHFEREIQQQFHQSFSKSLPTSIEQRSNDEKQLIQSIQHDLNQKDLILRRTADDNNVFYLSQRNDFNDEVKKYLQNSTTYELIGIIDETNTEEQQVQAMMKSIDIELEKLYQNKLINKDHRTKLSLDGKKRTNIRLPYLYFLPDINADSCHHLSVQPRMSSCEHWHIQPLAHYLEQLLRPLFTNLSRSTSSSNASDFMQRLDQYGIQEDSLLPKTKFVAFHINDLYNRMEHSRILTALNRFLVHPVVNGRHQRLTSEAIEVLTSLVLRHQFFIYQNKIYRYVQGSSMNFSFSQLLADIYLHDWQSSLLHHVRLANEFYCRYHHQGLFTWYGDITKVEMYFHHLNETYADIQAIVSIGSHVHFLHAYIENRQGHLFTCVHHDVNRQPFLLPYVTGHPRLLHRQWFRFALIRAGQYCTSFEDFDDERLRLELTFLAHGYSLAFVEFQWKQFYKHYNTIRGNTRLNRYNYPVLRRELFRSMNQKQQQMIDRDHPPLIQLHYLFDWGQRCEFNRTFRRLWTSILEQDPVFKKHGLKIQLNTKHCYSSTILFDPLLASSNSLT